jgi:dipeptidase E
MRLLLLSNSRNPGQGYLEHPRGAIGDFAGSAGKELPFIPCAGVQVSPADYAARVQEGLAPLGIRVRAVTDSVDPVAAVRDARAITVGGGNTFQLLRLMYQTGLLAEVRQRVLAGVPYLGWSAGSNLACPPSARRTTCRWWNRRRSRRSG